MRIFVVLFCLMSLTAAALFAAHPLTTDDAGTVEPGKYELEAGYDNLKEENILRNHSAGISLSHGLTEKVDMGVSFPYQIDPKISEPLGTATMGFKFLIVKDVFAFTVNNELGSTEYFVNGIFTRDIRPLTVHANVGYAASGDETVPGEIIYSSALEYPLSKIDLAGEIIGEKIGLQNWLLGVRYRFAAVSSVNFAYGTGFRNTGDKIAFGLHTEF